jgi:hypothetical protein
MCDRVYIYVAAVAAAVFVYFLLFSDTRENYRDPIFLNRRKYLCDIYPRANGSIYGEQSHILSGFQYNDKAY